MGGKERGEKAGEMSVGVVREMKGEREEERTEEPEE